MEDDKVNQMLLGWDWLLMIYFLNHRSLLKRPTSIAGSPPGYKAEMLDMLQIETQLPKTLLTGEK